MNKGEFLHRVRDLTGIAEREQAERVTNAVLGTLCGRITRDEASDLEAQLPEGIDAMCRGNVLKDLVSRVKGPSKLEREAFLAHVQEEAKLSDATEADRATRAVFHTLKEQITEGEAGDVASQLPARLKIMWLES